MKCINFDFTEAHLLLKKDEENFVSKINDLELTKIEERKLEVPQVMSSTKNKSVRKRKKLSTRIVKAKDRVFLRSEVDVEAAVENSAFKSWSMWCLQALCLVFISYWISKAQS